MAGLNHYDSKLLPSGTAQHYVALSTGIRLHYLELKPSIYGVKDNGITVVFVHGFPELSFSWKDQMKAVAQSGYTAIAPDMRGYGFTDCPAEVDLYSTKYLGDDLDALLDSLGVSKAVFVGHDWGGFVVWSYVFQRENRCLAACVLNTPLSSWYKLRQKWEEAGCSGPMEYLKTRPSEETGELDYQVYFNIPKIPEKELEADVEKTINAFFRSQTPDRSRKDHFENMRIGMRTAKARKDNNRGVLFYCPEELPRDPLWTDEEIQVYVSAFQRTGFFGPLCWYRNIDENIRYSESLHCEPGLPGCKIVDVPCLMVTAEFDVVLSPESAKGMDEYFSNLSWGHVNCGHWTQKEQTLPVNSIIVEWLEKSLQPDHSKL